MTNEEFSDMFSTLLNSYASRELLEKGLQEERFPLMNMRSLSC